MGGGVYNDGIMTMENGIIEGNIAREYGGGIATDDYFEFISGEIINNVADYPKVYGSNDVSGGGIYIGTLGSVHMKGGLIANNKARDYGGGVYSDTYVSDGDAYGGEFFFYDGLITENEVVSGHGGGVAWRSTHPLMLLGGEITNNRAPTGKGGGVYADKDSYDIFVGGDIKVIDNTAYSTNPHNSASNFYFDESSSTGFGLRNAVEGQRLTPPYTLLLDVPVVPLTADAKIGISSCNEYLVDNLPVSKGRSGSLTGFTVENEGVFFTDSWTTAMQYTYNEDLECYEIFLREDKAGDLRNPVMKVTAGNITSTFSDFARGWIYSLEQSKSMPTTVKLLHDWVAPTGKFEYYDMSDEENGTLEGSLILDDTDIDLTIDLNGYTIDRNLDQSVESGALFYISSGSLTIKDSSEAKTGRITGANNAEHGGAFFVYNGTLTIESGEISGNKATNGAGIYWESRNVLNLVGGKITGNTASVSGGGVYATDWGDIYLGGTANITDNNGSSGTTTGNLYLSDSDVYINHAKGQATGVPNRPLTEGAKISITSAKAVYNSTLLISDSNSCFDMESLLYLHSDNSACFVRGVYDEDGGNHTNQLYITPWGYTGYPVIDKVSIKNSELITDISLDRPDQIITITAKSNKKSSFENISLNNLINYTFAEYAVSVEGLSSTRNLTNTTYYRVLSSANTYVVCTVIVEFPECTEHVDDNGDYICDNCDASLITEFEIESFDTQTSTATVLIPTAGTYTVVFADYEGTALENFEFATVTALTDNSAVTVSITKGFTLSANDKVMLWADALSFVPICPEFIVAE